MDDRSRKKEVGENEKEVGGKRGVDLREDDLASGVIRDPSGDVVNGIFDNQPPEDKKQRECREKKEWERTFGRKERDLSERLYASVRLLCLATSARLKTRLPSWNLRPSFTVNSVSSKEERGVRKGSRVGSLTQIKRKEPRERKRGEENSSMQGGERRKRKDIFSIGMTEKKSRRKGEKRKSAKGRRRRREENRGFEDCESNSCINRKEPSQDGE